MWGPTSLPSGTVPNVHSTVPCSVPDLWRFNTDPDPQLCVKESDPDPALFLSSLFRQPSGLGRLFTIKRYSRCQQKVSFLAFALSKVHSHQSSDNMLLRCHKTVEIKGFPNYLKLIDGKIREAQKLTDPERWYRYRQYLERWYKVQTCQVWCSTSF